MPGEATSAAVTGRPRWGAVSSTALTTAGGTTSRNSSVSRARTAQVREVLHPALPGRSQLARGVVRRLSRCVERLSGRAADQP
ncbi:hypothetical protein ACFPM0_35825 [Pseudonocardia sulfidoxydans]|uniref:hypothetical protein n=1 Tax=Pseudonocardia sulfidoxydans TaxID=54011 RepID=UPI003622B5D7